MTSHDATISFYNMELYDIGMNVIEDEKVILLMCLMFENI